MAFQSKATQAPSSARLAAGAALALLLALWAATAPFPAALAAPAAARPREPCGRSSAEPPLTVRHPGEPAAPGLAWVQLKGLSPRLTTPVYTVLLGRWLLLFGCSSHQPAWTPRWLWSSSLPLPAAAPWPRPLPGRPGQRRAAPNPLPWQRDGLGKSSLAAWHFPGNAHDGPVCSVPPPSEGRSSLLRGHRVPQPSPCQRTECPAVTWEERDGSSSSSHVHSIQQKTTRLILVVLRLVSRRC